VGSYDIYNGQTKIGTSATTYYNATGLAAGTTYNLKIVAVDGAGNKSAASTALTVTTLVPPDTTPPSLPNGLVSSFVTTTSFTVSWNASTDNVAVKGYNVYLNGSYVRTVSGTSTSFTGLTPTSKYTVRVLAFDQALNKSAQSYALSVTTLSSSQDISPPSVPNGIVSSSITSSGFKVSWNASTDNVGVAGYNIYLNGSYVRTVGATSTSFTGLLPSTAYTVRVLAYDAAKNKSAQSLAISVTTVSSTTVDTIAPTVPTGLVSSNVYVSGFKVSWNASTDNVAVMGYNVYLNGAYVKTVSGRTVTLSGLAPSVIYSVRVLAYDAAKNKSAQSAALTVTTTSN
jgi:chitodextrinase